MPETLLPKWLADSLNELGAELGPDYTEQRLEALVGAAKTGNALTLIRTMNPYELARATFDVTLFMPLALPVWIYLMIKAGKRPPQPGSISWQRAAATGMIPPRLVEYLEAVSAAQRASELKDLRAPLYAAAQRAAALRGRAERSDANLAIPIVGGLLGLGLLGGLITIAVVASRKRR